MKEPLTVRDVMIRFPQSVARTTSVTRAESLMRQHGIRHLPVLDETGQILGLIRARDLEFAALTPEAAGVEVDAVMVTQLYVVDAATPLRTVVAEMLRHHYPSAVVRGRDGRPEGIFTSLEALRLVGELLTERESAEGHRLVS